MATNPAPEGMPLFYNRLEPLSNAVHGAMHLRDVADMRFANSTHAVPLTIEEFQLAMRHYPIVFTVGDTPVPIALMGLNEGINTFVDEDGKSSDDVYLPAYVRRYPFMLARLQPTSEDLTLCFDPTSGAVAADNAGGLLFEDGKPSKLTQDILGFCERFEVAAQQTAQFVKELEDHKLLMDGEFSVARDDSEQPYIYRGFRMVNEEALRDMRGDVARKLIQNGAMPLIYAHLLSLSQIRDVFGRQLRQDKMGGIGAPQLQPAL